MDILNNLNSRFSIRSRELGALEEEIQWLREFSVITLPDDYVNLIRKVNGLDMKIDDDIYLRIWKLKSCRELNEDHEVQYYIPNSLAIGDDGGGSAFILMEGNEGFGLYLSDFGVLDPAEAVFIAKSLSAFLIEAEGVSKI